MEEAQGGAAEAADIDREGDPSDEAQATGDLDEQTDGEERPEEQARAVVDGALTEEQAEELLRALEADQEHRRKQRTKREGERSGRGVVKDW